MRDSLLIERVIGGTADAGLASHKCSSNSRRRSRYVSRSSLVRKCRIRLRGRAKDHITWRNSYGSWGKGWKVVAAIDVVLEELRGMLRWCLGRERRYGRAGWVGHCASLWPLNYEITIVWQGRGETKSKNRDILTCCLDRMKTRFGEMGGRGVLGRMKGEGGRVRVKQIPSRMFGVWGRPTMKPRTI